MYENNQLQTEISKTNGQKKTLPTIFVLTYYQYNLLFIVHYKAFSEFQMQQ